MCEHKQFYIEGKVARLTESDDSEIVIGYHADIKIICIECHSPFQFIGLPGGYSPSYPTVNFDSTKMRVPIKP